MLTMSVLWSRVALGYHTPRQTLVGAAIGFAFAAYWYHSKLQLLARTYVGPLVPFLV